MQVVRKFFSCPVLSNQFPYNKSVMNIYPLLVLRCVLV